MMRQLNISNMLVAIILFMILPNIECVRKCTTDCDKIIKFTYPTQQMKIVSNKTIDVVNSIMPEKVNVTLGYRKVRNQLVLNSFGIWPEVQEDIFMPPTLAELLEWKSKEKCQIGKVCAPKGPCWGSDAQICKDNSLNKWVSSARFQWEGMSYERDLMRTCIKEWECSISVELLDVYVQKDGTPYIAAGTSITKLSDKTYTYDFLDGTIILVEPIQIIMEESRQECLELATEYFCEMELNGQKTIINILKNDGCSMYRNNRICIKGVSSQNIKQEKSDLDDMSLSASKGDLEEIQNEIRASFADSMFNDMIIRDVIQKLMSTVVKIIHSESRFNPMIVHDILGNDVSSEWDVDGIKLCGCLPNTKSSCEWSKSVLRTKERVGDCSMKNKTIEMIDMFGEGKLNTMMPDKQKLRNVNKKILEKRMEENIMTENRINDELINKENVGSSFLTVLGFSSVKEMFWTYLPMLNLTLVIITFVKR